MYLFIYKEPREKEGGKEKAVYFFSFYLAVPAAGYIRSINWFNQAAITDDRGSLELVQ